MLENTLLGSAIALGVSGHPILAAVSGTALLAHRQSNASDKVNLIGNYSFEEGELEPDDVSAVDILRNYDEEERNNRNLIPDSLALCCDVYCLSNVNADAYRTRSFSLDKKRGWIWLMDYLEYPTRFDLSQPVKEFLNAVRHLPYIHNETGLVSGLFFQVIDKYNIRVAYVTKGTSKAKDWVANLKQGWDGDSALYQQSQVNARHINRMMNAFIKERGYLYFMGHSLGGGLANLNAMSTSQPAITFNAASVHPDSVGDNMDNYRYLVNNKAMIGVYVEGEVLSLPASEAVGLPKNGNRYVVKIDQSYLKGGDNAIERHYLKPLCARYKLESTKWEYRIYLTI